MFVVPEARRHGVGRQLLQAAEDAALGFGVTRLPS
jgi:GNAT superfamily N-acetyltransferase